MLKVGIIGLPNAGKSTLFNALLRKKQAETGKHPFTTIQPNKGIVDIPDSRLDKLFEIVKPNKKTNAKLAFVDVAGLIKGAHQGEGLGNEFLSYIREVDCILHVLRAFDTPKVPHSIGSLNPQRDLEIVETELLLSDNQIIERHLKEKKLDIKIKEFLKKAKQIIDKGKWIKELKLSENDEKILKAYPLLTAKPILHIMNVEEKHLEDNSYSLKTIKALKICAKLESDLIQLSWVEQKQYLKEAKIKQQGLEAVVSGCYYLLGLSTFYTITGGKETKAWIFKKGTTTIKAASMIHTDIKKGFIKAEVLPFEDFVKTKSWEEAKIKGMTSLFGKDHEIKDGDTLEIKFAK